MFFLLTVHCLPRPPFWCTFHYEMVGWCVFASITSTLFQFVTISWAWTASASSVIIYYIPSFLRCHLPCLLIRFFDGLSYCLLSFAFSDFTSSSCSARLIVVEFKISLCKPISDELCETFYYSVNQIYRISFCLHPPQEL